LLFRQEHWAGLADGTITVAFRRWTQPRAKAGRRARFPGGVLMIDDVEVVDASKITAVDARRAGFANVAALQRELERFGEGDTYRIALHFEGPDEREALRADDDLAADDLAAIRARLERLDRSSPRGPWTRTVLDLIAERPAVRAPDLAASLGLDTVTFKRDVRKLKELGLTESLTVGYRISPRGRAVADSLGAIGSPAPGDAKKTGRGRG
jgi:hypothetical protein